MLSFKKEIFLTIVLLFCTAAVFSQCKECDEVAKGKIPTAFLDKSLKELPSGIQIWDIPEILTALKEKESRTLYIDTRPESFYKMGTLNHAVLLICDQNGKKLPLKDAPHEFTKDKLLEAIKTLGSPEEVRLVFFCQGPKCHRSYNAALRCVREFGIPASQVVWFRAGYPKLFEKMDNDPKLSRKKAKYLMNFE